MTDKTENEKLKDALRIEAIKDRDALIKARVGFLNSTGTTTQRVIKQAARRWVEVEPKIQEMAKQKTIAELEEEYGEGVIDDYSEAYDTFVQKSRQIAVIVAGEE